jgi:hypothetical protein
VNSNKRILKTLRLFILWYVIAILLLIGSLYIIVLLNDFGEESSLEILSSILSSISKLIPTYFILLIPYFLFLLIRSLVRNFKKRRFYGLIKGFTLKIIAPLLIIWGSLEALNYYRQNENYDYNWDKSVENKTATIKNLYSKDLKQRGIHFFGSSRDTISLETLNANNIEWLTIVPFISQENYDLPKLRKGFRRNDSTPKHQRWRNLKQLSDTYGFKIMLKPHIWLSNTSNGVWRSDIKMKTQSEWDLWFEDYDSIILDYAALAEELKIEQFCIGTELHTSAIEQPEHWRRLIKQIRNVYSGKLTYGANWDRELSDISFWDDLDFIGVQAYFPIAKNSNPDLTELESGWKTHLALLESLNICYDKPILFTEIGYKTTEDAGITPWEWNTLGNRFYKKISKRTQALCYEAFFNTIWQQPWFEGAHLWQWQSRNNDDNGNNNSFTLQGKPALNVVAKGFAKITN